MKLLPFPPGKVSVGVTHAYSPDVDHSVGTKFIRFRV